MSLPYSCFIRIGDITCEIASVDPSLKITTRGTAQNFLVAEGEADVTIKARWDDLSDDLKGEKIFDSGALWQLYSDSGKYLFSLVSPAFGVTPYKVAQVNRDFTRGEVLLHRPYFNTEQPIYPLEYPLDELLFINFLTSGRGVEIHACGVVDSHGRGHLFAGQSGAGKTTMARLWQGESDVTILSDDRIVLRRLENKIWMYGTPWHGDEKIASPRRAPLKQVYFLRRGIENELIPVSRVDAMGNLYTYSFLPFYNVDAIEFSLGFFEKVVKTVPCHELRFVPDKEVVEFIKGLKSVY